MTSTQEHFTPVSGLAGQPVRDSAGEAVGSVRELLVDLHEGRIAYVLIELTDAGADTDCVTIPWSAVLTGVDGAWHVAATAATLTRLARSHRQVASGRENAAGRGGANGR